MTADINIQNQLPEGFTLDEPQGLPEGFVIDAPEPVEQQPVEQGFLERVGGDISGRAGEIEEIKAAKERGEIGSIRAGLQEAGQAAGGFLDIGGEALESGLRTLPDPVEKFVRSVLSAPVELLGQLPSAGGGTIGEAIPAELAQLKETDPNLARDLEAMFNIGTLAIPVKGKVGKGASTTTDVATSGIPSAARATATGVEKVAGKTGKILQESAEKSIKTKRRSFVESLAEPIETQKVLERAAQEGRLTEKGLLKKRVVQPSKRDLEIAGTLEKTKVSPKNSFTANNNIVIKEIGDEAESLVGKLKDSKVIIVKGDVKNRLSNKITTTLDENAFLTGNAELTLKKIEKIVHKAVDDNPGTPAGLLEARKQIDKTIRDQTRTQSGKTLFDSPSDRAVDVGIKDLRNEIHNYIDEITPNIDLNPSLKKQELLFDARDVIKVKAAKEGSDRIRRLVNKVSDKIPFKTGTGKAVAAAAATGAIGTGAAIAPAAAGAALISTLAINGLIGGVRSPQVRKALSAILKGTDKAIKAEKNAQVLKQLRADRAFLIELMKQEGEDND